MKYHKSHIFELEKIKIHVRCNITQVIQGVPVKPGTNLPIGISKEQYWQR